MSEADDLDEHTRAEIPEEPWFVVFTQKDGADVEYDTNFQNLDLAIAMVQKGLYLVTEDALDDDYGDDDDDEDSFGEDGDEGDDTDGAEFL